jgi:hypothetical protein
MLDLLTASPDAGFFTGSELADWYANVSPAWPVTIKQSLNHRETP